MHKENSYLKKVEQTFGQNPKLKEAHFTSDGFAFTSKERADGHSKTLAHQKVELITRKEGLGKAETPAPTPPVRSAMLDQGVKKLTVALEAVKDIPTLEALKAEETALGKEARKTAIAAIDERIKELNTPAIEVVDATEVKSGAEGAVGSKGTDGTQDTK
jgi:hypothetical protein